MEEVITKTESEEVGAPQKNKRRNPALQCHSVVPKVGAPQKNKRRNPFFVKLKKQAWAYIMILPLVIGVCIFGIYPPIQGIIMSFFDIDHITDPMTVFCGIDNFIALFQDITFLDSLKNLLFLQFPRFIINIAVPFLYAELMFCVTNQKMQAVYRNLILLPIVCPGIVLQLVWSNIYAYNGGVLNEMLTAIGMIQEPINFLGPDNIIPSLIFMSFPWLAGTSALIVFSGLISIPKEVLEAAGLDGCKTFRRIFVIDMAYLIGQIKYVVVFGIINIFQDYSNQLLFAERVGDKIHVPAYYMYWLIQNDDGIGKAAAIGVTLFVIIMLITAVTYKFLNKKDEEVL